MAAELKMPLDEIDPRDESWRLSRTGENNELRESVHRYGILEPLQVMMREGMPALILSGHARYAAAVENNHDSVPVVTRSEAGVEYLFAEAVKRQFQRRIGPIGKLRGIVLLDRLGAFDQLTRFAQALGVPEFFISQIRVVENLLKLPVAFLSEIDRRDIPFRTIEKMCLLGEGYYKGLGDFFSSRPCRVTVFQQLVDLLADLERMNLPARTVFSPGGGSPATDQDLYERCHGLRYPRYGELFLRAAALVRQGSSRDVKIELPKLLASDRIAVVISIRKHEGGDAFVKKAQEVQTKILDGILELL